MKYTPCKRCHHRHDAHRQSGIRSQCLQMEGGRLSRGDRYDKTCGCSGFVQPPTITIRIGVQMTPEMVPGDAFVRNLGNACWLVDIGLVVSVKYEHSRLVRTNRAVT